MADPKAHEVGPSKSEAPSATGAESKKAAVEEEVEDVPDPDEDDLDDLDDMLNDFSALKVESKKAEPETATGPGRPAPPAAAPAEEPKAEDALSDDEFAEQLQAGMADLLGEIESSPEIAAQFEHIFKEFSDRAAQVPLQLAQLEEQFKQFEPPPGQAPGPSSAAPRSAAAPTSTGAEGSFQETIRRTMDRMQASGEQAAAAAAAGGADPSSDDFIAELLKEMQAPGGPNAMAGGDEEFSKMLLGMMDQLTTREILYEPMKELNDKFPDWLKKNQEKVSKEDLKRYQEQQVLVREIVAKFEEPGYMDGNTASREYIVDRMQKMQAAGSPPADLVGDMPSAQDALNMPDESCNQQ